MRIATLSFALILVGLCSSNAEKLTSSRSSPPASLFAQSAARKLSSEFDDCGNPRQNSHSCDQHATVSFLLLDAHSGALLASHWEKPGVPIPLGSLVKPFTALAYGERHEFHYPTHTCHGTSSGCWLPRGHGEIDLTAAIANSCNSYFRMLAADVTAADVSVVAKRLDLEPPNPGSSGTALAGLGAQWQISPLHMARAYIELIHRKDQPGVQQVVEGMSQSALRGTGAEVDRALGYADALVKTGTAPCTHSPHAPGDGFAIAMVPAADPQILLMVRVHGVPGSHAAKVAGQMLRRIEE